VRGDETIKYAAADAAIATSVIKPTVANLPDKNKALNMKKRNAQS
jgi:hypothetical protein